MKNFIRSLFGLGKPSKPAASPGTAATRTSYPPEVEDEFARLDALDEARGKEAVVVYLRPQVPLRDAEHPRSWLGGGPAMAEDVAWPEVDGVATRFIGQICCADLPDELWDGVGPREGWLALFVHSKGVVVKHLSVLGPWRERPDGSDSDDWLPYMVGHPQAGLAPIRERPRWPVDLIAVRPGEPKLWKPHSSVMHQLYAATHDAASPEHRPFDRNSTLEMLAMIERRIDERLAAMVQRERDQATTDEQRGQSQRRRAALEVVLPPVRDLAERVRAVPALAEDDIADIMQQLSAISVPDKSDGTTSLTQHPGASWLWVWDFEERRLELAKQVYSRDPAALPEPARSYCEAIWRQVADGEMATMGQVTRGHVEEFDGRTDVALIELRSTDLIGWNFGDVSNLFLSLGRDDLAAGRFDRVVAETPN